MNPQRYRRVDEIFAAALERPIHVREAFLDEVCGDDVELCREVAQLLEAESASLTFFDRPLGKATAAARG